MDKRIEKRLELISEAIDNNQIVPGCRLAYELSQLQKYLKPRDAKGIENERTRVLELVNQKFDKIVRELRQYLKMAEKYPGSYKQTGKDGKHDGAYTDAVPEKQIARGLFNINESGRDFKLTGEYESEINIGRILDYEVPIFRKEGKGKKVDLISADERTLYLLELKRIGSLETLLRCMLESFSYSVFVDKEKLKRDFGLRAELNVVICPLIFKGSIAYYDLKAMYEGEFDGLLELKRKIEGLQKYGVGVRFAVIDPDGEEIKGLVKDNGFKAEWIDPPKEYDPAVIEKFDRPRDARNMI